MNVASRTALGVCLLAGFVAARADLVPEPLWTIDNLPYPYSIELADLNNDGRVDVAVSCWHRRPGPEESYDKDKHRVLMFFQRDGRFNGSADRELAIASPWGLLAGDFDGDGKTDLVVKETRRHLHLYPGSDIDAGYVSANVNDSHRTVSTGRLSRGGLADFLSGPVWRKWYGGDKFMPGYFHGPEKNDNGQGVIADLDGDGHNDVIFIGGGCLRLYYGPFASMGVRPAELSRFVEICPPGRPTRLAVADMNADGRPDLVVGLRGAPQAERAVAIYLQSAPMGFAAGAAPSAVFEGIEGCLLTPDLNQDGLADLIVGDTESRQIYVFVQRKGRVIGTGTADAYQILKAQAHDMAVADITGNGFPDLAVSDGRSTIRMFRNDGQDDPERARAVLASSAPKILAAQEFSTVPETASRPPAATVGTHMEAPDTEQVAAEIRELLSDLPVPGPAADHNDPERMPYYTGAILPTPQRVTYHDRYLPLAAAGVLPGEGIEPDGPYVRELRDRIERYGGKLEVVTSVDAACDTLILLGRGPAAEPFLKFRPVPEREQAYVMSTTRFGGRDAVLLAGHDRLGLLWAISSFNQLVHNSNGICQVRAADMTDYPSAPNRGFIAGRWLDGVAHCIAFKINKPVFQSGLVDHSIANRRERHETWRHPLPDQVRQDLKLLGERLSPFGIRWYAGHNPIACEKKIRSGNEEDFQVVLSWAIATAEAGGNFCLKYDDHRFPISPEDQEQFGTAREADIHLLTRLHRELKARYPECRILFCPPFYWGPTSPALYPEPRDDYLFALGERLPQDIEIFWTGPRVKSAHVTREMVQWITERIQRKPVYWQNAFGMPHMFLYHYATDPIPILQEWFYDGFLLDMDTYMFNCMMPAYAAATATCADFCWNPQAYDPDRSIAEAATKLVGADTYPALVALNRALSYFDKFGLRRTPAAARMLPEMQGKLAVVNAVWEEIGRRNANAVSRWTGMQRHVEQVNRFTERLRTSPELAAYRMDAGESEEHAIKEVGFNAEADIFLSAYDFVGGRGPSKYSLRCEERVATWIYGSRTSNPHMESSFRVEPFPPSTDYALIISAQDDEAEHSCGIRIWVNDTVIFEGSNPFVRQGWSRHTFRVPAAALTRQSTLRIENTEDSNFGAGPPFFMLNYAVVRKAP